MKIYRLWNIPAGEVLSSEAGTEELKFDNGFSVLVPGVAGYPYEGQLRMAEYPEDCCLIVRNNFLFNMVYPSLQEHPLFDGRVYDKSGKELTLDDIKAFQVPARPQLQGMCLYGYARGKT